MAIVRWQPFGDLAGVQDRMNRIFDEAEATAEELGLDVGDQVTLTASADDGLTQPVTLRERR